MTTGVPSENVAARIASRGARASISSSIGHSHQGMKDIVDRARRLLIQPKNWATSVGVAHLVVNASRRRVARHRAARATDSGRRSRRESGGVWRRRDAHAPRDASPTSTTPIGTHAGSVARGLGPGEATRRSSISFSRVERRRRARISRLRPRSRTEAALRPGPITSRRLRSSILTTTRFARCVSPANSCATTSSSAAATTGH